MDLPHQQQQQNKEYFVKVKEEEDVGVAVWRWKRKGEIQSFTFCFPLRPQNYSLQKALCHITVLQDSSIYFFLCPDWKDFLPTRTKMNERLTTHLAYLWITDLDFNVTQTSNIRLRNHFCGSGVMFAFVKLTERSQNVYHCLIYSKEKIKMTSDILQWNKSFASSILSSWSVVICDSLRVCDLSIT